MEYEIVYLESGRSGISTERQKGFLGGWVANGWELITVISDIEGSVYGEGNEISGGTYLEGLWFYFKRERR
ncbi:MAG TPA: hypothetical protein VIH52_01810 [Candidatus Nanoarchaeia archaeon]